MPKVITKKKKNFTVESLEGSNFLQPGNALGERILREFHLASRILVVTGYSLISPKAILKSCNWALGMMLGRFSPKNNSSIHIIRYFI